MLECRGVTKRFGGLVAVNDVSFSIKEGDIVGLIGPNGAGKTTLFNVINGFYKPDKGEIWFNGNNVTGFPPHKICKIGMGRTFQLVKSFNRLSVLENVVVGGLFGKQHQTGLKEIEEEAYTLLSRLGLDQKGEVLTRDLNIIDRKLVELCRALATQPKFLMLDEIISGLTPTEVTYFLDVLKDIQRETGVTIFLIEHIMKAIMSISRNIIVIHHGVKIAEGTPQEIANDEQVINAYLGAKIDVEKGV
jgi:branched-chain amino acid transport system ATP-binding protein